MSIILMASRPAAAASTNVCLSDVQLLLFMSLKEHYIYEYEYYYDTK